MFFADLKNDKFYKKSVLTICAYYVKIPFVKAKNTYGDYFFKQKKYFNR